MLLLLPSHGGSDDLQQLLVRSPRTQQISQGHLRVPEQTHLGDEEDTRAAVWEAPRPPGLTSPRLPEANTRLTTKYDVFVANANPDEGIIIGKNGRMWR